MSRSLAIPFDWNEGSRGRLVKDAELGFDLVRSLLDTQLRDLYIRNVLADTRWYSPVWR